MTPPATRASGRAAGDGPTPVAEAIAASLCWLSRWNNGQSLAAAIDNPVIDGQVGFWHRKSCRFCPVPLDEVLARADLGRCDPDELKWWRQQDRKVRAAKVYEAQEEPWWEKLP